MAIVSGWRACLAGVLCAFSLASPAGADTLLDTGAPESGFFGYWGYDVYVAQSVTIGFTATQNYSFDSVSLWLMSNDFENPGRTLTVSLQSGASAPSGTALESWTFATTAVGWTPVQETLNSVLHPTLQAGTQYWIVAESTEEPLVDPVWVIASNGGTYTVGNIDFASSPAWQIGPGTAAPGTVITATAVPEPSALALAALGVPLLVGIARRRARAAQA